MEEIVKDIESVFVVTMIYNGVTTVEGVFLTIEDANEFVDKRKSTPARRSEVAFIEEKPLKSIQDYIMTAKVRAWLGKTKSGSYRVRCRSIDIGLELVPPEQYGLAFNESLAVISGVIKAEDKETVHRLGARARSAVAKLVREMNTAIKADKNEGGEQDD